MPQPKHNCTKYISWQNAKMFFTSYELEMLMRDKDSPWEGLKSAVSAVYTKGHCSSYYNIYYIIVFSTL